MCAISFAKEWFTTVELGVRPRLVVPSSVCPSSRHTGSPWPSGRFVEPVHAYSFAVRTPHPPWDAVFLRFRPGPLPAGHCGPVGVRGGDRLFPPAWRCGSRGVGAGCRFERWAFGGRRSFRQFQLGVLSPDCCAVGPRGGTPRAWAPPSRREPPGRREGARLHRQQRLRVAPLVRP